MYLFDMDGTLIDSNDVWKDVDREFLARRGLPYTKAYYEGVAHTIFPLAAKFTKEFCNLPDSEEDIMAEWMELAKDAYAHVTVKPGVRAFLKQCKAENRRMALVTSSVPVHCRTAMEKLDLMKYFESVTFAQELGIEKKDKRLWLGVAERYGVEVNHYGMALCPFHNDRHPSLYVADDHYHCFACGEHGDVIDFVSKLFHLSLYDAAQKLAADFHLTPDKPPSAAALHAKRMQTEAQQLRENERLCFSVLSDYAHVLRDWKVQYTPQSPDKPVHARFVEACRNLDRTEYYLDILCAGDSYERAEVIQQQMADGKLDELRQRLEEIHKEEIEDGYDRTSVA